MRSAVPGEYGAYVGVSPTIYQMSVRATNHNGVVRDFSRFEGRDWVLNLEVDEQLDTPSRECSVTFQRRFDKRNNAPRNPLDASGVENFLALDDKLEVWTQMSCAGTDYDWIKIFEGRIVTVDPGGEEVKVTARDVCHDLTQVYIAPTLNIGGVPSANASPPQPGGDEEYEVIIG